MTKGAPQVIVALCHLEAETAARAQEAVDALAAKGYRTLGVARAADTGPWQFLGILPLFDPPREDAAATIADARQHGIQIKMVTGDNEAIAREISQHLGLGTNIQSAAQLLKGCEDVCHLNPAEAGTVEAVDGYAEVFPEHKYAIVQGLAVYGPHRRHDRRRRQRCPGHQTGRCRHRGERRHGRGPGGCRPGAHRARPVGDRAAVEEARRIFERMNSYAIYRIVETIRIMFFVVLAMVFFNFYPITAIMIILLAFFNDVPIMAIAFDNTMVDPNPVRWNMRRVLTLSTVLGLTGVAGSFLMLIIAKNYLKLDIPQIQTYIFLKMAVAGHLTLFVTRTPRMFLRKPHPAPILFWSTVVTKLLATLFVVYPFGLITPISWKDVGIIWAYCIAWLFMGDMVKLMVLRHLEMSGQRHRTFMRVLKYCAHPFCSVEGKASRQAASSSEGRRDG